MSDESKVLTAAEADAITAVIFEAARHSASDPVSLAEALIDAIELIKSKTKAGL